MIQAKNTPNHAGVLLTGEYEDLTRLCEALELVAGQEGERPAYESIRVRVTDLCVRLREILANGGHGESGIGVKIYWPEAMFVSVALNRFVKLSYKNNRQAGWEQTVARIRKFQESLVDCLRRTLPDSAFKPTANALGSSVFLEENYVTQYLDELNAQFLALDSEKRLQQLPLAAKRIVEQGEEYRKCKHSVLEAAKRYKCPVEEIRLREEYPDPAKVVW